jgi:hypothetical protein
LHLLIVNDLKLKYPKKNILLLNTTWLGDENIIRAKAEIIQYNTDILVLCSFVDAPFVNEDDFGDLDCKIICVGNYSEYRIDFWSMAWSEQSQHIKAAQLTNAKYPFLTYNAKPHPHRIQFHKELETLGIMGNGAISFGGNKPIKSPEATPPDFEESGGGNANATLNDTMTLGDLDVWNRSFINIVTETEFNPVERCFYSEKTWKPIVGLRPFLHYSSGNVNDELTKWGFETFENEFTDICDLDLTTYKNIANFCNVLVLQPSSYFVYKYNNLLPKIKHNKHHFGVFVNQQYKILNENICYN